MSIELLTNKSGKKTMIRSRATDLELLCHTSWRAMRNRCGRKDEEFADFKYYGGKGIIVCERWKEDFMAFYADMGLPPSVDHSLERRDGKLGYNPDNCCWATAKEQAINRDSTLWIEVDGVRRNLTDWANISGVDASTISRRYHRGYRDAASLFSKGELPKKGKNDLTIGDRTKSVAQWAREYNLTPPCIFYRIKIGLTGMALLAPAVCGRPKSSPARNITVDSKTDTGANPPHASEAGQAGDTVREGGGEEVRPVDGA